MEKNVLRKQFGNMYGKNKPFEVEEPPKPKLPTMEQPTFSIKGIILFTLLVFLCMTLYLNRIDIWKFIGKVYTDFKPKDKLDDLEETYNDFMGRLEKETEQTKKKDKESFGTSTESPADAPTNGVASTIETNLANSIEKRFDNPTFGPTVVETQSPTFTEKQKVEQPPISIEQQEKEKKQNEKEIKNGGIHQINEKLSLYGKHQIANYNGACYIGYDNKRECTNVYEGDICLSGQIFPTMEVCVNP